VNANPQEGLTVEIHGAAPVIPDFPSPVDLESVKPPFAANSPPSSPSGSGSHSRYYLPFY